MKETEVKILEINTEEITKKLIELGAKKIGKNLIQESFFGIKEEINEKTEMFRLRKIGDKTEIAYKGEKEKDEHFGIREEIQTEVKNYETIKTIMKKIGLKILITREKERISFTLNNLTIEIDKYPIIPAYLEIEGEKTEIEELVKKLGYEMNQVSSLTSTEVLKNYQEDPHLQKF